VGLTRDLKGRRFMERGKEKVVISGGAQKDN
jgi:hypothetical protein